MTTINEIIGSALKVAGSCAYETVKVRWNIKKALGLYLGQFGQHNNISGA